MASSIQSGVTIDRYRVIEPIGKGGMGEVYKAWDATLERPIALKILPPEMVRSEERVRRFVQEAKSASALNHPHIVTIHDIGQARLSVRDDDSSIRYIAMELVDGQTLRRKIHNEPTDVRTLIGWLAQAADGLAKAHAAGIVHRDLKPDNIMITRDGYAKVLDFGLAKLVERSDPSLSQDDPTIAPDATREGFIVGTIGYMSPEQIEAKRVDARSDIFAFGCILYEAATKRRPFGTSSDVDVMHRIVHDRPDAIEDDGRLVPADLRRIIRRCLAKSPDDRIQSMRDVAVELREIVANWDELSTASDPSRSKTVIVRAPSKPRWPLAVIAFVAIVVLAVAAFFGLRALRKPHFTLEKLKIEQLTSSGNVSDFDLSPDGKYFIQETNDNGQYEVWLKQTATGSNVRIAGPSPTRIYHLSFSPDGNYAYFGKQDSSKDRDYTLYRIPTLGGTPTKVLSNIFSAPGFSNDGSSIAFVRRTTTMEHPESQLIVASSDGSNEKVLARAPAGSSFRYKPSWSPDGKRIAIPFRRDENHENVAMVDATTGARTQLGTMEWKSVANARWLPDGSGVIVAAAPAAGQSQILFLSYPGGEPSVLRSDTTSYTKMAISGDGKTIAALQETRTANLMACEPNGENCRVLTTPEMVVDWVAPGTPMPVFSALSGGDVGLFVTDANGNPRQLTAAKSLLDSPTATADGKLIAFTSNVSGKRHVYLIRADGSDLRQLTNGPSESGSAISPDGKWVVYNGSGRWIRQSLDTGQTTVLGDHAGRLASYSPDGKELVILRVYEDTEHHVTQDALFYAPDGSLIRKINLRSDRVYGWAPTRDLYAYIDIVPNNNIFLSADESKPPLKQVTHFTSGPPILNFAYGADNSKLFIVRGERRSDVVTITDFR